jgi:hypothetical protein
VVEHLIYKEENGPNIEVSRSDINFNISELSNLELPANNIFWLITNEEQKIVPVLVEASSGVQGPQGLPGPNLTFKVITLGTTGDLIYSNNITEISDTNLIALVQDFNVIKYPAGINLVIGEGNNQNYPIRIILTGTAPDGTIITVTNISTAKVYIAGDNTVKMLHYNPNLLKEETYESEEYKTVKVTGLVKNGSIIKLIKYGTTWVIDAPTEYFNI